MPTRIGRFEVRSRIGAGAMGVVYRAFDPLLGRDVAVKVPHEAALGNPQAVARFLREPQAAAQLRHPHIVPVYDAGTDQGRYYIASAYIEGRTLEHVLAEGRPDYRRAADIIFDLADSLHYAHGLGIVHRDVKPANIMLDARGDALLMDFGLARLEAGEKLTHDGAVLGTPAYMAPEQAGAGLGEVGPASDQYSLGVMLYELLCGERPFHGPPAVVVFHVINEQPRATRTIEPSVPRDLETIALKAMAKRSADRYADCRALADDLRRWLEDRPIQARQIGPIERTVRWGKRRPALAALAAVLMVSAVVSTWFAFALRSRGIELRRALADAQAHSESVERANATIRERDVSLEQREAALETAEQEIAKTREALDDEQERLTAKDEEIQRQLDESERLVQERDSARAAKEIAEEKAKEAAIIREEVVESDRGWALYKANLVAAQAALLQRNEAEAQTLLRACPKEHRSWEWKILWSRSHGRSTTWSWTGGGPRFKRLRSAYFEPIVFDASGKVLPVHNYEWKTVAQGGKRVYAPEELLTFLDSKTGNEINSVPWPSLYTLHPDGNSVAMVLGKTKIVERPLGENRVDVELTSTEPREIEWIGYHPDGVHLSFVEREAEALVVRTIHRISRQLAQVTTLGTPPKDLRDTRQPIGRFTPDGRFFLFDHGKVLSAENNNVLALPVARVFSQDLSIGLCFHGSGSGCTALLGLPGALADNVPVREVSWGIAQSPVAISPDRKRAACYNVTHNGPRFLAIWDITSPDPQAWQHVIDLSDGVFPTTSYGVDFAISSDWMRAASRTRVADPKNPRLGKQVMQKITVESWGEPAPEDGDEAEAGAANLKLAPGTTTRADR